MKGSEWPVVQWSVDTGRYNTRPVSGVFRGASEELKSLVLNFRLHPMLAVPMSRGYFLGSGTSYYRAKAALDALKAGAWVELALNYGVDVGRARVWKRTARFEKAFRMRVGKRLLVREAALRRPKRATTASRVKGTPIASVPGLETYSRLVEGVRLSMSDGSQIFRDVVLYRKGGGRIYAHGGYGYQNMRKEERPKLLIDGETTAELDYKSMHANLLLNREGFPCRERLYEAILGELGLEVTEDRRNAVKALTSASFNIKSKRGFAPMARLSADKKTRKRHMQCLPVRPKELRLAITAAHPELSPYVCTGDRSAWLQGRESDVMVTVLETLARQGVVALPLHDSVIVPDRFRELARLVMEEAYQALNGFAIGVG